jgi:quercetin dioxygenase-like cupin family protein
MPSPAIPGEFELVHLVQDFEPGASTPVHTHGGQGLALVLDGELTQRMEGQPDKVYKAGETFIETPGVYFAVANASNTPARLSVAFLLPKGATLTTAQQPAATPTVMQEATAMPTVAVEQPTVAPAHEEHGQAPIGMPRTGSGEMDRLWVPTLVLGILCLIMSGLIRFYRIARR